MIPPILLIMTDANGFTTCLDGHGDQDLGRERLLREAGRIPLMAPIDLDRWELSGQSQFPHTLKWKHINHIQWWGS